MLLKRLTFLLFLLSISAFGATAITDCGSFGAGTYTLAQMIFPSNGNLSSNDYCLNFDSTSGPIVLQCSNGGGVSMENSFSTPFIGVQSINGWKFTGTHDITRDSCVTNWVTYPSSNQIYINTITSFNGGTFTDTNYRDIGDCSGAVGCFTQIVSSSNIIFSSGNFVGTINETSSSNVIIKNSVLTAQHAVSAFGGFVPYDGISLLNGSNNTIDNVTFQTGPNFYQYFNDTIKISGETGDVVRVSNPKRFLNCGIDAIASPSLTILANSIAGGLPGHNVTDTNPDGGSLGDICVSGASTGLAMAGNNLFGDARYLFYGDTITQPFSGNFYFNTLCSAKVLANFSYTYAPFSIPVSVIGTNVVVAFKNNEMVCDATHIQPSINLCGALSDCTVSGVTVIDSGGNVSNSSSKTHYPLTVLTSLAAPAAPTLTASSNSVSPNTFITFTITLADTTKVTSLELQPGGLVSPNSTGSGLQLSTAFTVSQTTTFTLTVYNAIGSANTTTTVTVASSNVLTCPGGGLQLTIPSSGFYTLSSDINCGMNAGHYTDLGIDCQGHNITLPSSQGIGVFYLSGKGYFRNCKITPFDAEDPAATSAQFIYEGTATSNSFDFSNNKVAPLVFYGGCTQIILSGFYNLSVANNYLNSANYVSGTTDANIHDNTVNLYCKTNSALGMGFYLGNSPLRTIVQDNYITDNYDLSPSGHNPIDDPIVVFNSNGLQALHNTITGWDDCAIEFVGDTLNGYIANNILTGPNFLRNPNVGGFGIGICGYPTANPPGNQSNIHDTVFQGNTTQNVRQGYCLGAYKSFYNNQFIGNTDTPLPNSGSCVLQSVTSGNSPGGYIDMYNPEVGGGINTNNSFSGNTWNFPGSISFSGPPVFDATGAYATSGKVIDKGGNKCFSAPARYPLVCN